MNHEQVQKIDGPYGPDSRPRHVGFCRIDGDYGYQQLLGQRRYPVFYNQHYISGTNGQFRPNEDITREGAAAIINNMIGEDSKVKTTNFSDVKGRWSERAIASLVDKQIMSGYSNGTFKPEQKITREEFAVIAYNYMTYKGMSTLARGRCPYARRSQDFQLGPSGRRRPGRCRLHEGRQLQHVQPETVCHPR